MTRFDEAAQILQGIEVTSMQWSPGIYHGGGVVTTRSCDEFATICDRLGVPARKREVRPLPGRDPVPEHTADHALLLVRHVCFPHLDCHQPAGRTPIGDQVFEQKPDDPMAQDDLFGGVE